VKITIRVLGLAELVRLDAARIAERLLRDRASLEMNREMVSRQS
jgi:hypothetical protein